MDDSSITPPERESAPVAIVTGAGRGIGRAVALALARAGYSLCIAARTREELEETRAAAGLAPERALIVLVDLAGEDAPENLIDATLQRYGRLDVVVNNAGWAPPRTPLARMSAADQDRILALNLRAPIALTRLAAAHFAKASADGAAAPRAIVNIASSAARATPPGEAVYAAAKAGLVAFTHAAFNELRARNVRIAVVIPGLTDTALIPQNRRLDRSLMLRAEHVAAAVMQVIAAPAGACPVEIVLEPLADPMRPNRA